MAEPKKCEHEHCKCMATSGRFCSGHCAKHTEHQQQHKCECGHPACT